MKAEDRIGTVVNGFKILKVHHYAEINNAAVFLVQCCRCGKKFLKTIPEVKRIKQHNLKYCSHQIRWASNRLRNIYRGMMSRCYNPKSQNYQRYGGRGIIVCDEWRQDPENFQAWALENGYQDKLTIDRIDNDGNYEPSNCAWVTKKQNSSHNSRTHLITINSETHNLKWWCEHYSISYGTAIEKTQDEDFLQWLKAKINNLPTFRKGVTLITIDDITDTVTGWSIRLNINRNTLFSYQTHHTYEQLVQYIRKYKEGKIQRRYFNIRHKWINKRLRRIFYSMKSRCHNQKHINYCRYGERGITICQEWLDNPKAFEEWALEHGYQNDLTINRIDTNGNYEPSNCRWISRSENSKWKRRTIHIWIENHVDSEAGWSEKINKGKGWFSNIKHRHGFDYAYQRLLEEIEKLGGIKKVVGVDQEQRNRGDKSGR